MRSRQRNKKKIKKDKIVLTKTSNELEQDRTSYNKLERAGTI